MSDLGAVPLRGALGALRGVKTISVVLPCANESFVQRTVESIWANTPKEELLEIIIVDDASWPPVTVQNPRDVFLSGHVRILRQSPAIGLIQSKQRGAEAANGDAIVFLDCHVRPMPNWTAPLLAELRLNPRRIAVPLITGLNPDTWEELSPQEGGKKMCLTWSVDFFWCNELSGMDVPILSGGLLAISRSWWHESGGHFGYDSSMRSWGGENIDQSLRTWLCGGEIVYAEGSRVAHMWRDAGNPKTALHYSIPERDVLRNRLRAAKAWMGPWVEKVQSFQEFENIDVGSLSNFDELKNRLKCGMFEDYLRRFEALFFGTGMLPSSVFHLKAANGKCLTLDLYSRQLFGHSCIEDFEGQIWHRSNALGKDDLQCCSGLKLWNYNYCLAWYGGQVQVVDCSYFGTSKYQDFQIVITNEVEGEAIISVPDIEETKQCLNSGQVSRPAVLLDVSQANWTFPELELVNEGLFRAVAASGRCLITEVGLQWGSCESAAGLEVIGEDEGRKQLQIADQCLDAAQGTHIALYPCHPREERIPNQLFIAEEGGPLCWPFGDADGSPDSRLRCLGEGELEQPQVMLQPCANSPVKATLSDHGQVFHKHSQGEMFILKLESGHCLGVDFEKPMQVNGEDAFPLSVGQAECSQSWIHHEHSLALSSDEDWCLSANDFQHPVVTSCWPEDLSQHFEAQRLEGPQKNTPLVALRKRPHWVDSGRQRFPALCLDTSREGAAREPVRVAQCEEARMEQLWTLEWEVVPLETRLFRE
ncbi:Polypeptide N-acetylgalactosaminyltransferase 5 (Polypeptide GalNAc transferase 5) (GalNAc-T5) (pp-GaNTase 5) (Protein-UDP acetylgalactosaminyltransferase 5) (UDP-GalNAc:polypeptide N-acetylgalactosaminyltransferase 5) [Durusdinium trenchii]|uniref:Glycosyltransferase 2-like domain-containing protein n=1 Tax=Durusdinium trenchii TaxID=1381693 RepID=A0ABP0RCJ3_9DINO